jgi:ferritin-like metal-binding protein YciE
MHIDSLRDLYVDELRDLLSAENQLIKALPKMAKAANSPQLRSAFEQHLEQTRQQEERLQQIFQTMGVTARAKKCKGMEGVIAEGQEMLSEDLDPQVKDAALISAAQRAEHYEIAAYGTVRTYAQILGDEQAARLLQQTLDEEGQTDKMLTQLAESGINRQAQA